ncbi:MAG: tetratricopeptide repeat protein [Deltaproteobacteria bacterium]|uniref:Tetratricopeptide repeat protein n=1 Tax=Candidatus Zymogenus saltonus TaxID=2844893 RepID=A0A9D8PQA9_9DELT|nr:tetratricopeptide repeat protein [Candidatus Zymogenus saltonus]
MKRVRFRPFATNRSVGAIVALVASAVVAFSPGGAAAEEEWLRRELLSGINRIYNLDIVGGERVFLGISKKAPENPAPWIYRAMARMSYPPRDGDKFDSKEGDILKLLDTGIALSEKSIEGLKGEDLGRAKLLMATAHALKAELFLRQKRYLKSVEYGFRSVKYLDEAREISPNDPDILYAVGLLKYGSANVPNVLRPFLSLVELRPDKELGLSYIRMGAERGIYSAGGAKFFLMLISVSELEDYKTAAKLGKELVGRYPNNPEVYFPYAYALSEIGDYEGAFMVVDEFKAKARAATPYFDDAQKGRLHHLVGKVLMDLGRLDEAGDELEKALVVTDGNYDWVRPLALARLGMIHDLRGEREEALKRYREAVDTGIEGAGKALAEKYMKEPYSKEGVKGGEKPDVKEKGGGASSGPFKSGKGRSGF